jgi:hypothetical protein
MSEKLPRCEHWLFGDIIVEEPDGYHMVYERAILLSFKTPEEYRAALRFIDPLWVEQK